MEILVATGNKGKAEEIARVLEAVGHTAMLPTSLNPVDENGATYKENALLKGRAAAQQYGIPAIADDSGLEVAALNNAPGLYSARYATYNSSRVYPTGDAGNRARLLNELENVSNRTARLVCHVCLLTPAGDIIWGEGVLDGEIATAPRGTAGFGYDSLFIVRNTGLTLAGLKAEGKSPRTHRVIAIQQICLAITNLQ